MVNLNVKALLRVTTFLRILVGWHFVYEAIVKMYNPEWTSFGYLASAQGPFKSFFNLLISDGIIYVVDNLNVYALLFVGITFLIGFWEKYGAIVGIGLLALYYLAHPPFPWYGQLKAEGTYWLVNKTLIELAVCLLIYVLPTGHYFGLEHLFKKNKKLNKTE